MIYCNNVLFSKSSFDNLDCSASVTAWYNPDERNKPVILNRCSSATITLNRNVWLNPVFKLYLRHRREIYNRKAMLLEPRLIIWPEDAVYWRNYKWEQN